MGSVGALEALSLVFCIFSFWLIIGSAILRFLDYGLTDKQVILISPTVGLCANLLPVFILNRYGYPVKDVANYVLIVALVLAVLAHLMNGFTIFRSKLCAWLLIGASIAILLNGWPMIVYGLDWISFANDDMANYTLAAQRFLNHGYFELPDLEKYSNGMEYSDAYWYLHIAGGVRSGSDLILAFVWAVTGLNSHQVFMPTIMALNLALYASTAAMINRGQNVEKGIKLIVILMAVSPLTTLGMVYQLIGQVGGLTILISTIVLTLRPIKRQIKFVLEYAVAGAIVISSFLIWYPEMLPFFGILWVLCFGYEIHNKSIRVSDGLIATSIVAIFVFIFLNRYAITSVLFMFVQAFNGTKPVSPDSMMFPYYMIPSGMPVFFGLLPLVNNLSNTVLSIAIFLSIVFFAFLLFKVVPYGTKKMDKATVMFVVMLTISIVLFYRNNDFGLFKIAMYAQPFLIASFVNYATEKDLLTSAFNFRRNIFVLFLLIVIPVQLITQFSYVLKSTGEAASGSSEIPHASKDRINSRFAEYIEMHKSKFDEYIILTTPNVVEAKLQSLYTYGRSAFFTSQNYFGGLVNESYGDRSKVDWKIAGISYPNQYEEVAIDNNRYKRIKPDLFLGKNPIYVFSSKGVSVLNKTNHQIASNHQDSFFAIDNPKNILYFINSHRGEHYYSNHNRNNISFYQLERDPMISGTEFSSVGKYMLIGVLNAENNAIFCIEQTATVLKQFYAELPLTTVNGDVLDVVGRGSSRVCLQNPKYLRNQGDTLLEVEFVRDGKVFPYERKGLMSLYGRNIPTDSRKITSFVRDITLYSKANYGLNIPSSISDFPKDLIGNDLEYSGLYEDGWVSESSYVKLSTKDYQYLTISGYVPYINDKTFSENFMVKMDGTEVYNDEISVGAFEVRVPIKHPNNVSKIEMLFSKSLILPDGDGRMISAKINSIKSSRSEKVIQ